MTFTTSTTQINGQERIQILTSKGVRYDVRSKEAALEIIAGLLSGSNIATAEAAPKFAPTPKITDAEREKYGAWAGQL